MIYNISLTRLNKVIISSSRTDNEYVKELIVEEYRDADIKGYVIIMDENYKEIETLGTYNTQE